MNINNNDDILKLFLNKINKNSSFNKLIFKDKNNQYIDHFENNCFYFKAINENKEEIILNYNIYGPLRIDSNASTQSVNDFFIKNNIKVNILCPDNISILKELKDTVYDYISIKENISKKSFGIDIDFKENYYWIIKDENTVEMVISLILSSSYNYKIGRFRVDFFQDCFKYSRKSHEYKENNYLVLRKNLKLMIHDMLKNYSKKVDVEFDLKNFENSVKLLNMINH